MYLMFVALVVIQFVLVVAARAEAHFPGTISTFAILVLVVVVVVIVTSDGPVEDVALVALALDDVEVAAALAALAFPQTPALGPRSHYAAVTLAGEVLLEDGLAGGAVLAREIRAPVVPALLHAVRLQDLLVVAEVHVDRHAVYVQLVDAAEEAVRRADVVEDSVSV
jgi:hypothetical protein